MMMNETVPSERPQMSSDSTSASSAHRSVSPLRHSLAPIPDHYFSDDVYDSPDDSEGTLSDSTSDDVELSFGYPLERMPRRASSGQVYDLEQQITVLLKLSPCSSSKSSRSDSVAFLFPPTSYDSM